MVLRRKKLRSIWNVYPKRGIGRFFEAVKHVVLPLDDRLAERFFPDIAGRSRSGGNQLLFGGMGRLTESSIVNVKSKSHAVTAEAIV
jgi:hypothetical protein